MRASGAGETCAESDALARRAQSTREPGGEGGAGGIRSQYVRIKKGFRQGYHSKISPYYNLKKKKKELHILAQKDTWIP